MEEKFHNKLKIKIHVFVSLIYTLTKSFPKSELYGAASQVQRAALSIMLNYIEGYARKRLKVKLNFYETSHGSSQECKYLLYFAFTQKWISEQEYRSGLELINEIGKMLWSTIEGIERVIDEE
jgi:four helix bundle protein